MRGFFDDRGLERLGLVRAEHQLGTLADLSGYSRENAINLIYISLPLAAKPRMVKLLDELSDCTASVYFIPDWFVFNFNLIQPRLGQVKNIPVVVVRESGW